MFHYVCYEDFFSVGACFREDFVEELTCSSDEWFSGCVFFFSRVLTHKHQVGVDWSFPRNRVFGALPQSAFSTGTDLLVEVFKRQVDSLVVAC